MKIKINHLLLGSLLTIVSFGYWFLPTTHHIVGLANAVFFIGNILIFDYLSERLSGYSLLKTPNRRKHFLILGLLFGIILEFYLNLVGKFWHFPYWDITFFLMIFVPGYAAYSFYLIEAYLGTKAVLEHFFLRRHAPESFAGLKTIFTTVGILGAVMFSVGTTYLLLRLSPVGWQQGLLINQPRAGDPAQWYWYFVIFIGIWLLLDFLEYQRHETSLIYEIIKGNYWPIIAIFVAGIVSAVVYEVFNLHGGLWRYNNSNAPFSNIQFIGFPIMMYIGWPFHFLPVLSLYRLLFKKESQNLFR